jgi:NitT/TauT family transport system substrate-binding protein
VPQQPEPVTLKVLLLPYLSYAPFFIAEEEGYFAEEGLQIEFVKMARSMDAVAALAQGDLDVFGGSVGVGLFNAIGRGAEIKFVANRGFIDPDGCGCYAFLVRRDLVDSGELNSPAQLRSRRIGLVGSGPESYWGYLVEKLLHTAGLTLDDVEVQTIPVSVVSEALEQGTSDVVPVGEPHVTRILRTGHATLWKPAAQVTPGFQMGFMLYGPTLLHENPDAGRRFMVAYLRGVRQYNEGKTERNLEILTNHTGLDRELLNQACWPSMPDDGLMNPEGILSYQAWAVEKGYLDDAVTEEEFWHPSFVAYANEVLGGACRMISGELGDDVAV